MPVELLAAEYSVWTLNRESDLELSIKHGDFGNGKILIENKIDAAFQNGQPEGYATGANLYRDSGKWDPVSTVFGSELNLRTLPSFEERTQPFESG